MDPNGLGVKATVLSANRISVEFDSSFIYDCSISNNHAERELARRLLRCVSDCLELDAKPFKIDEAIDQHAPLGLKRRIRTFRESDALMFDNRGLPRVRRIQAFEMERIRDEVGEIASKHVKKCESLSTSDSHKIHLDIVKVMFQRLESEMSQYSDESLISNLIARHEALIAERRKTKNIIGTHLAAMGDSVEEREALQDDFTEIDRASTASRFLIEYVAAQESIGTRVLSTAAYDRILAIAVEIVGSGYLSDGFHHQVSETELELVAAKRLKFGASAYADAVQLFRDEFFDAQVDASLAKKVLLEGKDTSETENDKIDRAVETASLAEFRLGTEGIGNVFGGIALGQFASENGLGSSSIDGLIECIDRACDADRDSIAFFVEQLCAEPRNPI